MKLDKRIIVIALLIATLFYGNYFLDWTMNWPKFLTIFILGILTQSLFCLAFKIPINAMISATITLLLLLILFDTPYTFIAGMGSFFAISSKYIFHFKKKQLFNPAAFGIVCMSLFSGLTNISNYQTDLLLSSVLIIVLIFVVWSMHRKIMDVLLLYLILILLKKFITTSSHLDFSEFQSLSFILFTFLIILNPIILPNARVSRWIWVLVLIMLTYIFEKNYHPSYGNYLALICTCLLTPILDLFEKKETNFQWDSIEVRPLYTNDIAARI